MGDFYKLNGHIVVRCESLEEWVAWFETADRHVGYDEIEDITVSSVFLGIDHGYGFLSPSGDHDPVLFETMVFLPGNETGNMMRYFTWAEAEEGHKRIVEIIKKRKAEAAQITKDILRELLVK